VSWNIVTPRITQDSEHTLAVVYGGDCRLSLDLRELLQFLANGSKVAAPHN
jgi:hypothetical protein